MKVTEEKKHEYWNHFAATLFIYGSRYPGITSPRLRKIRSVIWDDEEFWLDILFRHRGNAMTPEQMAIFEKELYEHCSGNFWGMICQTLVEEGLMK